MSEKLAANKTIRQSTVGKYEREMALKLNIPEDEIPERIDEIHQKRWQDEAPDKRMKGKTVVATEKTQPDKILAAMRKQLEQLKLGQPVEMSDESKRATEIDSREEKKMSLEFQEALKKNREQNDS